MIRLKPLNLEGMLVSLFFVRPKDHIDVHGITTATKEQQIHDREALSIALERIFPSLDM